MQESPSFFCTMTPFTWFINEGIHGIMKVRIKKITSTKNHWIGVDERSPFFFCTMNSAQLCFIVTTLMPWCDAASISLPPVIDAYFPVQIVAPHSGKKFLSCKGGMLWGDRK